MPPTQREFEWLLDRLLEDYHAAQLGDPLTHWEKTRAFVLDAYRQQRELAERA